MTSMITRASLTVTLGKSSSVTTETRNVNKHLQQPLVSAESSFQYFTDSWVCLTQLPELHAGLYLNLHAHAVL